MGSIRPRDLLVRGGGEVFVVALIPDASVVAERIRSALATALGKAPVPGFTVTIGPAAPDRETISSQPHFQPPSSPRSADPATSTT